MLKRRDREPSGAGPWLLEKLAALAAAYTAPLPARLPQASPERGKRPRYVLKDEPAPSLACPPDVPQHEWDAAARNVAAGSPFSTIAKGSDVPSDFALRIQGLAPRR